MEDRGSLSGSSAEQAGDSTCDARYNVARKFGCYNHRRYSRPWGAVVSLGDGGLCYDFTGVWLGDSDNGGEVVIRGVGANAIVAFGQKDNRNPKYTENEWYRVLPGGDLEHVTRAKARAWLL